MSSPPTLFFHRVLPNSQVKDKQHGDKQKIQQPSSSTTSSSSSSSSSSSQSSQQQKYHHRPQPTLRLGQYQSPLSSSQQQHESIKNHNSNSSSNNKNNSLSDTSTESSNSMSIDTSTRKKKSKSLSQSSSPSSSQSQQQSPLLQLPTPDMIPLNSALIVTYMESIQKQLKDQLNIQYQQQYKQQHFQQQHQQLLNNTATRNNSNRIINNKSQSDIEQRRANASCISTTSRSIHSDQEYISSNNKRKNNLDHINHNNNNNKSPKRLNCLRNNSSHNNNNSEEEEEEEVGGFSQSEEETTKKYAPHHHNNSNKYNHSESPYKPPSTVQSPISPLQLNIPSSARVTPPQSPSPSPFNIPPSGRVATPQSRQSSQTSTPMYIHTSASSSSSEDAHIASSIQNRSSKKSTPSKRYLPAYAKLTAMNQTFEIREHLICKKSYTIGGKKINDLEILDRYRKSYATITVIRPGDLVIDKVDGLASVSINGKELSGTIRLQTGDKIYLANYLFFVEIYKEKQQPSQNNDLLGDLYRSHQEHYQQQQQQSQQTPQQSQQQSQQTPPRQSQQSEPSQPRIPRDMDSSEEESDTCGACGSKTPTMQSQTCTPIHSPYISRSTSRPSTPVTPSPIFNSQNGSTNMPSNTTNNNINNNNNITTQSTPIKGIFSKFKFYLDPLLFDHDYNIAINIQGNQYNVGVKELISLIKSNGGTFENGVYFLGMIHLVPNQVFFQGTIEKHYQTKKVVVKAQWVADCLERGSILETAPYKYTLSPSPIKIHAGVAVFPQTGSLDYNNLKQRYEHELSFHGAEKVDFNSRAIFKPNFILSLEELQQSDLEKHGMGNTTVAKIDWFRHCIRNNTYIHPSKLPHLCYNVRHRSGDDNSSTSSMISSSSTTSSIASSTSTTSPSSSQLRSQKKKK